MQPTIDAELSGARRMLEPLTTDSTVPADAVAQLKTVIGMLKRLERSWSRVLPHLVADNVRLAALLRDVASSVPPDLQDEIERALSPQRLEPGTLALDVEAANQSNEELRDLLAKVIACTSSSPGPAGTVRVRALASLRQGLETRPW